MPKLSRRRFGALTAASALVTGALQGCSLPRGAAQGQQILASAAQDEGGTFAVYAVTRDLLPRVARWPMTGDGPRGPWISAGGGRSAALIKPGDRLELVVWDNSDSSLLTSNGTKAVPLSQIIVAPDGMIFVPYLDRVQVAGKTTEAARQMIQERLIALSPAAQVQLMMAPGPSNSVDIVGGVGRPGSYPLRDGRLTVLGLVAQAGGVLPELDQPVVRLVRGGRTHVTTVKRLYENPGLDTALQGGDQVIVDSDPRRFIALGAAGREQIIRFPTDEPTAIEAVAAVGGVNDLRGDPKAVLILREYGPRAVADGIRGPEAERVIFVIDLTTADGLFSAGRFAINPDDVVYVTESPLNAFRSITQTIGAVFGLGVQAARIND